jgi:NAD(P)-dependent dehydrogenase (short-subunit alcohol dehydrogenase family)
MSYFTGKVAIVTGGASGIGRGLCEELAREGARVIVADINAEAAAQTASRIAAGGHQAHPASLDVSREEDVRALVHSTAHEHGRLDYMFNNAGVGVLGEVKDMALEHWHCVLNVDLWGVIHGTTAAYAVMCSQGHGHIVNTASLLGLISGPTHVAYSAAKHAVVGLSTSLRAEAVKFGVKVSVVCPGFVQTGIWDTMTVLHDGAKRRHGATAPGSLRPLQGPTFSPTQAAGAILCGVRRNREVIVFPRYARLLWWLYRLHPALLAPLDRKLLEVLRSR